MTSAARMAANAENAKKSTGPRTEAGKNRVRLNAVKHGLTARVVFLSSEKQGDYKELAEGWFQTLRPRDAVEVVMAERSLYAALQLDRLVRARSAQACLHAEHSDDDERKRIENEVNEQGSALFRNPKGRTAVSPPRESASRAKEGASSATSGSIEHPMRIIARLHASLAGCEWLAGRWQELKETVEQGFSWRAPERFRLFRLLGIQPMDAYVTAELTFLVKICEVLDPGAGSVVSELWSDAVSATDLASVEESCRERMNQMPAIDQEQAREALLAIVERERAKLAEGSQKHQERLELEALLKDHRLSADTSREGQLLYRYECASERLMLRYINELKQRHAGTEIRGDLPRGMYYGVSRPWTDPLHERTDSADENDGASLDDLYREFDRAGAEEITSTDDATAECDEAAIEAEAQAGRTEVDEVCESAASVLRNEANELPEAEARVLRNEPNELDAPEANGLRNESDEASIAEASVLRNEPNGLAARGTGGLRREPNALIAAALGLSRRDAGHGDAVVESRRRRKLRERNRRKAEQAARAKAGAGRKCE